MIQKINSVLNKLFHIEIIRISPKEAIRFGKKHFQNAPIKAIEIGVLRGENSLAMLKNLNIHQLFLIDPYVKYDDYKNDGNYKNVKNAKISSHKKLKRYSGKIIWVEEYSDKAIKKIKGRVDFVYIDGNHSYEYVKKDLELYWPKLKSGGILSGHDIQMHGVSRAVLEFANKRKLDVNFGERRDWWIIKK